MERSEYSEVATASPDEGQYQPLSRRDLFRGLRGGRSARRIATAAMGLAGTAMARRSSGATPASADVDPGALLTKLVRRCGYGPIASELALAQGLGYSGYLEYQLDPATIDDSAVDPLLAPLTTISMSPSDLYLADGTQPSASTIRTELQDATMIRAVFSKRQLLERMVEFWTDHFSIDILDGAASFLKTVDDREVIRQHALGDFRDLVTASALSPAMLEYLNNNISIAGNPNENYARELMELHTLGVTGPYTQTDVIEVARCFTGWTFWNSTLANGTNAGTFRYRSEWHDTGQKVVLGNVIPARTAAAGQQDGYDVINILVNHPSTANFVSGKLCRWLLGEGVSSSTIAAVAATYTSSGRNIKEMIRTALAPNVLYDAPARFKRPFHLVASCLRQLPVSITAYSSIRTNIDSMGNGRFRWLTPDGYPNATEYWSGLLLPRWNFGALLMNGTTGSIAGVTVDDVGLFSGLTTVDQHIAKIDEVLFQGEMVAFDRQRVRDYLATNIGSRTVKREAIGLALASPSYQWY